MDTLGRSETKGGNTINQDKKMYRMDASHKKINKTNREFHSDYNGFQNFVQLFQRPYVDPI